MKKKIYFLSASDRINFGDILFPIIFQYYLDTDIIDFQNYAYIKSDLQVYGAIKTKPYEEFLKEIRRNEKKGYDGTIVIGGGEILFTKWQTLLSYISQKYNKLRSIPYLFKILEKLKIDRILFKQSVKYPFSPTKKELNIKATKIAFNSVGGYGADFEHIKKICKDSEILSVRSNLIYANISKKDCGKVELNPDSAILLPKIMAISEIESKSTITLPTENYFFFQIKKNFLDNNLLQLAEYLNEISETLSLKIVLCPIGKAFKHEDQVPLRKIEKLLNNCSYIEPTNLFDIIYLLNNAKFYVGSSLHGAIISQAYNIPFFPLDILKITDYIGTWTQKRTYTINELSKIPDDFTKWNYEEIAHKTIIQQQKAENLILRIINI